MAASASNAPPIAIQRRSGDGIVTGAVTLEVVLAWGG
jgi:hypothetical protein